jgi:hypothetical protein
MEKYMTSTPKTPRASPNSEETTFNVPMNSILKQSKDGSLSIGDKTEEVENAETIIRYKLAELDARCIQITMRNLGKDTDYAIKVIRSICKEISSLEFKTTIDRPVPGSYSYDAQLLRNIDSIVLKIELLSDKYFSASYKKYGFINHKNSCYSKDKLYELADEWLSDRRIMVELVSSMVDEIQELGITPNPVLPKDP